MQPLKGVRESETPCFTLRTPYAALGRSLPWKESVSLRLLVSPSGLLIQPSVGVCESETPCFTFQTPYAALGRSTLLMQPLEGVRESETPCFTLRTPYTALGRSLLLKQFVRKGETGRHVKETNVCVFGGKSVRVISLVETRQSVQCLTDAREFEDWVWDVQWLRGDNKRSTDEDDSLALALGHNSVVEWQWRKDVILHHVHCEEKCILYCAKFIGSSWDHLVLAAGTVFNQVALWSVGSHVGKRAKVLHRLMGHQGVIFAIDFHRGRMQICSASDDRSIRLWQLHCHNNGGRLSSDEIVTCWDDVTFEELFVFYGHSARVWGARLLTDHIVSVGE
ncbi:hypothetical protein LSAT2_014779, partial [Lamellibrachia satsuma]